jgi:signal transduction histidine kinase
MENRNHGKANIIGVLNSSFTSGQNFNSKTAHYCIATMGAEVNETNFLVGSLEGEFNVCAYEDLQKCETAVVAFERLMEHDVLPNLPLLCLCDPDRIHFAVHHLREMDDLIVRPVDQEELKFRVRKLVASQQSRVLEMNLERRASALEKHQRWMEALLNLLPTPIVLIDPENSCVVFGNKAADRIAGGFPRERVSDYYHKYYCVDRFGRRLELEEMPALRAANGERLEAFETDWVLPSGRHSLLVYADTIPGMHDDLPVCAMVLVDVTNLRQIESNLQERARELAVSNAELAQVAYVGSHDLKEPLRTISIQLQLLERQFIEANGIGDGLSCDWIRFVNSSVTRMYEVIDGLLAYTTLGSSPMVRVELKIESLIEEVLTSLRSSLDETGARLSMTFDIALDEFSTIFYDRDYLFQILQHLISNAIKFRSSEKPDILLNVKSLDAELLFSLTDNGIGIDPQNFERIFELFQQLHPRGKYPGVGLGLALCRKIVERNRGRIWVASTPGRGATFYFTIPTIN